MIDKSVSAKTALFPAKAGPTGCAVSGNDHENTLIGDSGSDLDCGTGFSREAVDLLSLLICGARLICF